MNDTLSNSFFYFFSAVPQVLAAILALFGFFLVFKIQALKEELVELARDVLNYMEIHSDANDTDHIKSYRQVVCASMRIAIRSKNIAILLFNIIYAADEVIKKDKVYTAISEQYMRTFDLHKNLVHTTKAFSIITIFTIISCLTVIPLAKYILVKPELLQAAFFIAIMLILMCFLGFLWLLQLALSNKSSMP